MKGINRFYTILSTILIILFPYPIVNEEMAAPIVLLLGLISLFISNKSQFTQTVVNFNKNMLLCFWGMTSIAFSNNLTKSLNGLLFILAH